MEERDEHVPPRPFVQRLCSMPTLGPRFSLDTAQRRKWGLSAEDKYKNEGSRRSDIDSEGEGSSRSKSKAGIEALAAKTRRCQWTKVQTRIWARRTWVGFRLGVGIST